MDYVGVPRYHGDMEDIMTVAGYVELTLKFEREEGKWVGTCLELGTSTYAKTLDRVQKDLRQLVPEHLSLWKRQETELGFLKNTE